MPRDRFEAEFADVLNANACDEDEGEEDDSDPAARVATVLAL